MMWYFPSAYRIILHEAKIVTSPPNGGTDEALRGGAHVFDYEQGPDVINKCRRIAFIC